MAELTTPAGIGFEALNNILIGFYRAGASDSPASNEDVSSRTGQAVDTITRNNGFFEDLMMLTREGPKHRLTEAGRDYAKHLHYGQLDDAKLILARLIMAWEPAAKLLDMVELKGPLGRPDLVAQIGMRAEVAIDSPRYSTGVNALIDLMLFAGLVAESDLGILRVRPLLEQELAKPSQPIDAQAKSGESREILLARRPEPFEIRFSLNVDPNTDPEQIRKVVRAVRLAMREDLDERGKS